MQVSLAITRVTKTWPTSNWVDSPLGRVPQPHITDNMGLTWLRDSSLVMMLPQMTIPQPKYLTLGITFSLHWGEFHCRHLDQHPSNTHGPTSPNDWQICHRTIIIFIPSILQILSHFLSSLFAYPMIWYTPSYLSKHISLHCHALRKI